MTLVVMSDAQFRSMIRRLTDRVRLLRELASEVSGLIYALGGLIALGSMILVRLLG